MFGIKGHGTTQGVDRDRAAVFATYCAGYYCAMQCGYAATRQAHWSYRGDRSGYLGTHFGQA